MMSSIATRQNDPRLLDLLRAAAVSHARARRLDGARLGVSVVLAGLGLLAVIRPGMTQPISVIGALWGMAYALGLAAWGSTELKRAALLQDMFDVRLFDIRWSSVVAGEPVPAHEVSRLSKLYRGPDDLIVDYYEVPDLPSPYDVLACQQQSLAWGARVRRRYAAAAGAAAGLWAVTGGIIGVSTGMTFGEIVLRWFVPSLGVLLLGIDTYRGQLAVAKDRERALGITNARILAALRDNALEADLPALAREVQDLLLLTRQRVPRVPDWFFLRFRADDRKDFESTMEELADLVARQGRP